MDQVQMQQQHQQQMSMQHEQQQRQQISSTTQVKTVKQVQQFQTYEQQFSSGVDGSVQYQLPQQQQQSLQYQMSQQTSNAQHVPAGMEYHIPIQQAELIGPKHGVPTPFATQNSMAAPQSAHQNAFPSQFSNQNVTPSNQFTNQNVGPPQHTYQNAPVPTQYANQNVNPAQYAPTQNVNVPIYASGTTKESPDGYTTAYDAVHGEWPPKQNDAPNLTTTYPSGIKLKDQVGFQAGPGKVVTSQPAFKITQPIRRSGDDKWPPRGAAEPTQEEVREFVKPKKSNKDYEAFFAQNALPHNYAGYRPPPGTQHHGILGEEDGVSNM